MTDRSELFEATLDGLPDGVALFGKEELVVYWNRAAEEITGYKSVELIGRPLPEGLDPLLHILAQPRGDLLGDGVQVERGAKVAAWHKLGHETQIMARCMVLRDSTYSRIGTAVVFHSAAGMDSLPHGEDGLDDEAQTSQEDLEERLQRVFEDYCSGGPQFGVLWIMVDQAVNLRKSHGGGACEAMLAKVERALGSGLRPGELLGRWGKDEFLIVAHEKNPEMLTSHAQMLAGMSRTADFRWWGDRISLTVSIGAAQAEPNGSLVHLLERAKAAMFSSYQNGGNQITSAPGGQECSPS
jgi:diguanylate cyclase (GGDEF)-like protein/PAS domain S-box-containing protein